MRNIQYLFIGQNVQKLRAIFIIYFRIINHHQKASIFFRKHSDNFIWNILKLTGKKCVESMLFILSFSHLHAIYFISLIRFLSADIKRELAVFETRGMQNWSNLPTPICMQNATSNDEKIRYENAYTRVCHTSETGPRTNYSEISIYPMPDIPSMICKMFGVRNFLYKNTKYLP